MITGYFTPEWWAALLKIIGIDIVLSGDNAVVIALACRSLPPSQKRLGVLFGTAGAVFLRVVLIFFVGFLMNFPFLKLVGALLLLWIGIKLILPEDEHGPNISDNDNLMAAVRTIIIADFVMSLDNVIGIAGAAHGDMGLIIIGLLISLPMDRFPMIITIGGALLGYVAGEMAVTDRIVAEWVKVNANYLHYLVPIFGAIFVVVVGKWLASRRPVSTAPLVNLATEDSARDAKR